MTMQTRQPRLHPAGSNLRENGENGIALLLTLGILALLLILALSFAMTARIDLAASNVYSDMVQADLMCRTGVERALAYLKFSYPTDDLENTPDHAYPATLAGSLFATGTAGTDWEGRYWSFSSGTTDDNGLQAALRQTLDANATIHFVPDAELPGAGLPLPEHPSWLHVKTDGGDLIGRFAYVIIDEGGKIDPNGVLTPDGEPYFDTNSTRDYTDGDDHYFDIDGSGSYTSGPLAEGSEVRSGGSPHEINIDNAIPAAMDGTQFTMAAEPYHWFSWAHIVRTGLTGFDTGIFNSIIPFSYDIEAYHDMDDQTDYHRFDLARDWDAAEIQGNNGADGIALLLSDPIAFDPDPDTNTGGISWLDKLEATTDLTGDGTEGSAADNTAVRRQVAANIIDFADDNDTATSDYDMTLNPATQLSQQNVTYVGLERVPYINEIAFTTIVNADAELTVQVEAELINIYDEDIQIEDIPITGATLYVYVDFADDGPLSSDTFVMQIPAGSTIAANSYLVSADLRDSKDYGVLAANLTFDIEEIKVALHGPGDQLWDYAHISGDGTTAHTFDLDNLADECSGSAEAIDPRANTFPSGWGWHADSFNSGLGNSSIGGINSGTNAIGGPDTETVADPAGGLSTAFIRNAPFKSLWELGAIHRGEAWRTLNLTAYNDGSDLATTPATYANGDAAILDQVKLGPYLEMRGKVNINSPYADALRGLLGGITVGGEYDAPGAGTALSDADVNALVTAIRAENGTTGGAPFLMRGAVVADVAALSDGSGDKTQDTQRTKEEIIGKIANLLTVRQNLFTIIAVGQSVHDLGAVSAEVAAAVGAIQYEAGRYCRVLAERKVMAVVYRDAFTNTYRVLRKETLEK